MDYAERKGCVIWGACLAAVAAAAWAAIAFGLHGAWVHPLAYAVAWPFALWWMLHTRAVRRHLAEHGGLVCPRCGYACPGGRRVYVCTECGRSYSQHDAEWFARRWSKRPWWVKDDERLVRTVVVMVAGYAVAAALVLAAAW